ncbi:MAG: Uma2 family endonuclease [Planctomycetota bacterium]
MRPPTVTTAEQLLKLHDPPWRHELVRGELRTMSPAGHPHGDACIVLGSLLHCHARAAKIGKVYGNDTGFVLARKPDTVLAPDLAFVSKGRLPRRGSDGFYEGLPDLAVEVRSPRDSRRSILRKAREWLEHGCRGVWIVDPKAQSVTVLKPGSDVVTLGIDDTLTGDELVPGFEVSVREIFADLEP